MTRPLTYGRDGTPVIPDTWVDDHAPVIEATLACTVTVGPAGGKPAWSDEQRRTVAPDTTPLYDGPADIVSGTSRYSTGLTDVADQLVAARVYVVELPRTAQALTIRTGHVVRVTDAPNPALTGRTLVVAAVNAEARELVRRLVCTLT